MKIRNNSNKVIGIGSVTLMPDDEREFSRDICELPSVKALVGKGFLAIEGDSVKVEEPKDDPKAEEPKEEPKAEEAVEEKPKKTTRKKKSE